jgi:hypothetical protein
VRKKLTGTNDAIEQPREMRQERQGGREEGVDGEGE